MTSKDRAKKGMTTRDVVRPLARIDGIPPGITAALSAAGIALAYLLPAEQVLLLSAAAQKLLGVGPTVPVQAAVRAVERRYRRSLVRFFDHRSDRTSDLGGDIVVPLKIGDGARQWVKMSLSPDDSGGAGHFVVLRDVTAIKEELESLNRERDHLRHTVELNPQLPWLADAQGNIIAFTERYEKLTGRTQEELVGEGWALITHPDDIELAYDRITHSMMTGAPLDVRVRVKTAMGTYRWMRATAYPLRDEEGQIIRWFGYTEDIDDHVLIEQQIRWTAEHDALTKLPNRMVFNRRLEQMIREENRMGQKVAILLVDVDNFKDVNDVLGHDSGDALLMAFADLMGRVVPEKALLARIGGDEFAIIFPFEGPLTEVELVSNATFAA
ncbi:MAG: diguanylate cyclase domain-containing protein, partial [Gammaproteobacteria bacterium]